MGYAAEYLTRGKCAALDRGCFSLMPMRILYHFWDVRRILLPPPRQFRTPLATASRLGLQPRGICGLDRHRSFEFYRSSTSSSSTIVFNQRHRLVAHRTPSPCEENYPNFHSFQPAAAITCSEGVGELRVEES